MLYSAERSLNAAKSQSVKAGKKAEMIMKLQGPFLLPIKSSFNAEDEKEVSDYQIEKHERERRRAEMRYQARHHHIDTRVGNGREVHDKSALRRIYEREQSDRTLYQFEADSDDDQMEDEISANLENLTQGVRGVKLLSQVMQQQLGNQNKHLDLISAESDQVDDNI
ncbi:Protein transport protein S9 plasma membrane t-SNARE, partial [Recurvomyces mirabilis]